MPRKFADGSNVPNARRDAACVRALDASLRVVQAADKLSHELDDLTSPGVPIAFPEDEDSLVDALHAAHDVFHPTDRR